MITHKIMQALGQLMRMILIIITRMYAAKSNSKPD